MPWRDSTRAQPDSWFGVGDAQLDSELDLLSDLDLRLVRFELPWALIERQRARFSWERADRLVEKCDERRLIPVLQVVYTPPWAGSGQPNDPPRDPELFADFARAAAERYRGRVKHWEVWNEPNLARYWTGTIDDYAARLLPAAAQALRDTGSAPLVLLGGLAGGDGLPAVLRVAPHGFDIASFHYYPPRRWPVLRNDVAAVVRRIRTQLADGGRETAAAWLTEFGAMASRSEPPDDMPSAGAHGQLELLRSAIERSGADAVLWYTLRDHEVYSGESIVKRTRWGLFDIDRRPRPAARWLAARAQERRAEIT